MNLNHITTFPRPSLLLLTTTAVAFAAAGVYQLFNSQTHNRVDAEHLSYQDVVSYFIETRPKDKDARKGALLRKQDRGVWVLSFVFLDAQNTVWTAADGSNVGRTLRVRHLDGELAELFGDKSLLIFE